MIVVENLGPWCPFTHSILAYPIDPELIEANAHKSLMPAQLAAAPMVKVTRKMPKGIAADQLGTDRSKELVTSRIPLKMTMMIECSQGAWRCSFERFSGRLKMITPVQ